MKSSGLAPDCRPGRSRWRLLRRRNGRNVDTPLTVARESSVSRTWEFAANTRLRRCSRIDELPDDTSSSARSQILIGYPHADTSRATQTITLSFRPSSPTPPVAGRYNSAFTYVITTEYRKPGDVAAMGRSRH